MRLGNCLANADWVGEEADQQYNGPKYIKDAMSRMPIGILRKLIAFI